MEEVVVEEVHAAAAAYPGSWCTLRSRQTSASRSPHWTHWALRAAFATRRAAAWTAAGRCAAAGDTTS